jgi:Autophagy receptor ATG43
MPRGSDGHGLPTAGSLGHYGSTTGSKYSTIMSREHWHLGSRSDYITSLALSHSHAEHLGRVHSHSRLPHDTRTHMPKRLQPSAIPDLRFEPTYLAKLSTAGPGWKSVVWVTMRDQVISPLIQGVLWCVTDVSSFALLILDVALNRGTASIFIQPLLRSLTWWRSSPHNLHPSKEGSAASWLRQWARSLLPDANSGNPLGTR